MNEKVLYRVRVANAKELRKEVAMMILCMGFSLKKVLIVEGGAFLLSLLQCMLAWSYGEREGILIYLFAPPLFVFGVHLWFVLSHMLGGILRVREKKNTEQSQDIQFCFFAEYYQDKSTHITYEWAYDDIVRVRETRSSFLLENNRNLIFIIVKKNFLEGDPSSFKEFLSETRQSANSSKVFLNTGERQGQSEATLRAGTVLNEEVCIRNEILEHSWAGEKMSPIAYWARFLEILLIFLPIFFLMIWASFGLEEDHSGMIIAIVVMICVVAFSAVRVWKKRGLDYRTYQKYAIKTYRLMAKKGMLTQPMSYSFFGDCFEMTQGSSRQICQYAAVRRMYQTPWYLVLMVGIDVSAKALSIDKRGLGEDCQRLMDLLKEKTGLEWRNSPV